MNFPVRVYEGFIILRLIFEAYAWKHKCPDQNLTDCICRYAEETNAVAMWCQYQTHSKFMDNIEYFSGYEFDLFAIQDSIFHSIWDYMLRRIKIKILQIASTIMVTFNLFKVLSETVSVSGLVLLDLHVYTWEHSSGSFLKEMRFFRMEQHLSNNMPYPYERILNDLPENLTSIEIRNCIFLNESENIGPLFSKFKKLESLDISYNVLHTINRNYLPFPANNLRYYNLRHTELTYLPDNAFYNMTRLVSIDLRENQLSVLRYEVFQPVLSHLGALRIQENIYICDCDVAWLLSDIGMIQDNEKNATCVHPASLHNRTLVSLSPKELCYAIEYSPEDFYGNCKFQHEQTQKSKTQNP